MHRSAARLAPVFLLALALGCAYSAAPEIASAPPASAAPPRTTAVLPISPERALGDARATVGLVVFSDFQCPYCRQFHEGVLAALKRRYIDTGRVRLFHKDLPLPMHSNAMGAAIAARCAGQQGHYWPMQDRLYQAPNLGVPAYLSSADGLGLDRARFEACLRDPAIQRAINLDRRHAQVLGVNGTPSFVLGHIEGDGVHLERLAQGAPSYETFVQELDKLLAE